jgi:tetratricopeptide (TPR) repeat protein
MANRKSSQRRRRRRSDVGTKGSDAGASTPARSCPEAPSARPLTAWKKALFALAINVTFFVLLELALAAGGVTPLAIREDPLRGFSGLVSVFERDGDVLRTRPANATTFNPQSFLAEKPPNGLRIFGLGGSSTFGFPWGADAAFTQILGEAIARLRPDLAVEAVNAGGTSYAMHRVNLVVDELLDDQPDVFVVYSGHNEFVERSFFEALKEGSAIRNRLTHWLAYTRIYTALRALLEPTGASGGDRTTEASDQPFDLEVRRDETRAYSEAEKAAVVEDYRAGLSRLTRRARAAGVHVVLVTVPANLSRWRPEASTNDPSLGEAERRRWGDAFVEGRRALRDGALDVAEARLAEAAELDPGHAETWFLLGQAREGLGRFDAAARAYALACDLDASPIRRISGINEAIRSVAREEQVPLVDADRLFAERSANGLVGFELVEDYVHPTRAGHELIAWHVLRAMADAGWLGEGVTPDRAAYDRLLAERHTRPQERNATWFYNQGVILTDQGALDAAIEKYREAVRLQPDYREALTNLGLLLTRTGRSDEAVPVLEHLVAIDPGASGGHLNLGNALQALGRYAEAVDRYREAIRLSPELAFAHNSLGNALQALGRYAEAEAAYARALALRPDYAAAHTNWGNALSAQQRADEAVTHYAEALRLQPDYANAHLNWGMTLARMGRFEEAIGHFEAAARIRPDDPNARRLLAAARADRARQARASAGSGGR